MFYIIRALRGKEKTVKSHEQKRNDLIQAYLYVIVDVKLKHSKNIYFYENWNGNLKAEHNPLFSMPTNR